MDCWADAENIALVYITYIMYIAYVYLLLISSSETEADAASGIAVHMDVS
jgi:hypothetical protein